MEASVPAHRRPPALLPPSIARLGGFAALALLGALQWQRMVEGLSSGRALLWVLVAVVAAAAVIRADALRRFRAAATLAVVPLSLFAAYVASGLPLVLLKPRRLDELGAGLSQGAEALTTVHMPYAGADPWPSDTLQLLGALLCVAAALLAFWPRSERTSPSRLRRPAQAFDGTGGRTERTSPSRLRRPAQAFDGTGGYPFLALGLLLILVAAPLVSLGGTEPVALGAALTALTVCFLWLERLPLRPGIGIAAMLALALVGALPLASAADGEEPWFDYKTFAEGLGPDDPIGFDWGHSYGPLNWPREGSEVLRVATTRPSYWKMRNLDDFDGQTWTEGRVRVGAGDPAHELPPEWQVQAGWRETFRVTLRRLQTHDVLGAGTTLAVEDTPKLVEPAGEPGVWRAQTEFRGGDSYTVRSYFPRPSPEQLTESGAGAAPSRAPDLNLTIPVEFDPAGGDPTVPVQISFPPFQPRGGDLIPYARYPTIVRSHDGNKALRRSDYARTWRLAKRLMREAETPYDYVLAVNRHLQDGFAYDEEPADAVPGRATLDAFLFDTRRGYCQHFSGAMALLLRMGGIPTRVVTGFSPGGYSKSKRAWIVRDTDAHSWVEAWFDDWGWVTFDPTPAGTPARSQIAAIDRAPESGTDRGDAAAGDPGAAQRFGGTRPDLLGPQSGPGGVGAGAAGDAGGGPRWWWFLIGVPLVLALVAWVVLWWRHRRLTPAAALDRAVAELEAALRRAGRPAAGGTTLRQLEQRLGRTPQAAAYLHALRAGRYASTAPPPTPGGRRALRRELAHGRGPAGRLRALWALPPWRA